MDTLKQVQQLRDRIKELENENKNLRISSVEDSIKHLLSLRGDDLILVKVHCKKEIEELLSFLPIKESK